MATRPNIKQIKDAKYTFNTLADLLAVKFLKIGDKVETLGYTTIGDGGNNTYEVVAAGTGTHDNGSYIDHANSGVQLKALFPDGRVFLEQFGCVIDGVTDDSAAFQAALNFADRKLSSAKGGQCNLGTATITFLQKGRKIGNDRGAFCFEAHNLDLLGQATFVLDSCKDVEFVGITALEVDLDLRGVWRSTVRNTKFRRLLMCTAGGTEFSDNYWNNFYNASFQQIVFPAGRSLNNANCFFGGIVRPKTSLSYASNYDHTIVIENPSSGTGAIEGMTFNGVDMEGGLVGFFDIDPTWSGSIDQGYFLFDQCYFDSIPPEQSDQIVIDVRLSQAQMQYPAPNVAAASLSGWDTREYFRPASCRPASALNKVVNGALKYESNKIFAAAPASMTWNSSAAGLYGRTVTVNNTGLTYFNHDDARQAGFYSVMLVMRAAATSRVKVDFAGVSSSVDLDSEFRVFTLYNHVKQAEGANINFSLSPHPQETVFDIELAYVSMQYGREINLGSAPSPGADIYSQSFAQGGVLSSGVADDLPSGWSSAKISTGIYEVTHNLNLTIRPAVTPMEGGARFAVVNLASTTVNKFRVEVYDIAGTLVDTRFEFIARTSKSN